MADYYSILGVSKSASDSEIKSAYKKKVVEWHPDRNKSAEAPEMIKKVNQAYEVLSDPRKKQVYDQVGHESYSSRVSSASSSPSGWPPGAGQQYYSSGPGGYEVNFDFGGGGFGDIFETIFGGGGSPFSTGSRSQRKRRDVYELTLSFEEAIAGVEKETVIEGKVKKIKIPAGVDNGSQIRFTDFDVVVRVKPHPYYRREGQDIYYEKDISYARAALGGSVDIPTIYGSPVSLKIRPGTQSGMTVRLSGKGIVYPRSSRSGDMYVVYRVKVPEKVSGKAKKLLEELEKEL